MLRLLLVGTALSREDRRNIVSIVAHRGTTIKGLTWPHWAGAMGRLYLESVPVTCTSPGPYLGGQSSCTGGTSCTPRTFSSGTEDASGAKRAGGPVTFDLAFLGDRAV